MIKTAMARGCMIKTATAIEKVMVRGDDKDGDDKDGDGKM
jgi:hypothetical protein